MFIWTARRNCFVGGIQEPGAAGRIADAIEENDRLIALLSGCIEGPEPVHVELGVEKMSNAGKHLALVSAPYSSKRSSARNTRNFGAHAHALRARDYRGGVDVAIFFRRVKRER